MPLINDNDITTLRKYVKMSFTATAVKSMPDIDAAERKFLIPILTQPVFDALQAQVAANTVTWDALLNLCRAAVAPLAVYLDLPFIQVQIEDGGLKTTSSDNKEAAHQWEFNKVQSALLDKGMAALEDVISHLCANADTYTWTNAETVESIFKTSKDFCRFVFLHQPNLTFQQLKPLIREVEDHFIRAAIGDVFFEALRDSESPSAEEVKAVMLIKKAVAQYTIVRAVERLPVRITPYGFMATLESSDTLSGNKPAADNQMALLLQTAQREGDAYQVELMHYLNANASASVFTTFFTSAYYTAPAEPVASANDGRKGVCAL